MAGPRVLVLERSPDLSNRVRRALTGLIDEAVVSDCHEIGAAERLLATAPFDVIVVGPWFLSRGRLRRLGALHARAPWASILLVPDGRPDASLADIIHAGADDIVPMAARDAELAAALARGQRIAMRRLATVPPPESGAVVVTVASATEGCGKTFVAANTAAFLARRSGKRVVLVDLDLQFGEVSTALRLRPDVTIVDAVRAEADGHDLDEHLDAFLLEHPDGFRVLAAPRHPAEADEVRSEDVTRILDLLRGQADYVVVDSPSGLSPLGIAALHVTDHLFVIATPDRPSLVNLGAFRRAIERFGPPSEAVSVFLNKAEPDALRDLADMAELLPEFAAVIPYDREVSRSLNLGVPLLATTPRSAVSTELARALGPLLPAGTVGEAPAARRRRLFSRKDTRVSLAAPAPAAVTPSAEPALPVPPLARVPAVEPRHEQGPEPLPAPESELERLRPVGGTIGRAPCPPTLVGRRARPSASPGSSRNRRRSTPSVRRSAPAVRRDESRPHRRARGRERAPPIRRRGCRHEDRTCSERRSPRQGSGSRSLPRAEAPVGYPARTAESPALVRRGPANGTP